MVARILAVDPGEKRWGLALADADDRFAEARPVLSITSEAEALAHVEGLVRAERVELVLLGLPLELSGREGPAALKARALGARLSLALACSVALWDERLTSVAASRAMRASGRSAKEQRGRLDSVAAALLLEAYLEASDAVRARALVHRVEPRA